jgi:hypothetical protein
MNIREHAAEKALMIIDSSQLNIDAQELKIIDVSS